MPKSAPIACSLGGFAALTALASQNHPAMLEQT
jgi:hypothetical protein